MHSHRAGSHVEYAWIAGQQEEQQEDFLGASASSKRCMIFYGVGREGGPDISFLDIQEVGAM